MNRSRKMSFSEKDLKKLLKENGGENGLKIDKSINNFYEKPKNVVKELDEHYVDGLRFDSVEEGKRYSILKLWQDAKLISNLITQHVDKGKPQEERVLRFILVDGYTNAQGKNVLPVFYIPDFKYQIKGIWVIEDYKGYQRRTFINKKKAFEQRYPDINFFLNFSLQGWYPDLYKERWNNLIKP